MFIFCLCDVGYWIRVNTVQKVKRKNMLPKYVGSFTAEARTPGGGDSNMERTGVLVGSFEFNP